MKYLYFHNGIFSSGNRYITIRRGDRWNKILKPREIVSIIDVEADSSHIVAKIIGVETMIFSKIPEELLKMSSNPECKTKNGLFNILNL